ncbi:MAG: SGNH/GDSL hydrolase family protein [Limisphaerales bacterium]
MGLLAASLVVLLVLDFGMKWVLNSIRERVQPDPDKRVRMRSPIYHHDLRPNMSVAGLRWGDQTYSMETSSLGFRDARVRDVALTNAAHRVLFIGDSFTEAQVSWEESFVGLIGRALADRQVEVLNAGVASYSPAIYYAKCRHLLETVGLKVQEVVVFVDISDARDEALFYELGEDGRVRSLVNPWPQFLKDHTLIPAECVRVWQRWQGRRESRKLRDPSGPGTVRSYSGAWTWDDGAFEDFGKLGQQRMVENMDALLALTTKHGVRLNVAFYPWPQQLYHAERPCRNRQLWSEWARSRKVPALDLYPAFQALDHESAVRRYFVPGDVHWNAAGNALVAETFLEAVRRRAILSVPPPPPEAGGALNR